MNGNLKKALILYGASFLSIPLRFAMSILNTSLLGPQLFGNFKFIETVARFISDLTSVGIFTSLSRLLAIAGCPEKERKYVGFYVIILSIISVIGVIVFIVFSWIEPYYFDYNLGHIIRNCSFIVISISSMLSINLILKGLNRIYDIVILSLIPPIIYLGIVYAIKDYIDVDVSFVLTFYYLILLGIIIFLIFRLKPNFNISKLLFKEVLNENKTNGKPIYLGSLAGVATTHIAGLSISYYINNT